MGAPRGRAAAMKKVMICGSGGREAALAARLSEDARVYAVAGHENPGVVDCAARTGGACEVGDPGDPATVVDFAKRHSVDYAFVSADQPLANGVVDALLEAGVKSVGATRAAARVEWDKVYAMGMMQRACPEFTPFHAVVPDEASVAGAVEGFRSRGMQIVVKPQGLTGGKGVKVMPEHLATYGDCAAYAADLLRRRPGEQVLLVERLGGAEFTVMGITDGRHLAMSPATYDYPYRHEGDTGPGTGGMGCFTDASGLLPFLSRGDMDVCRSIMQRIIDTMRTDGNRFSGVLNGGFFRTAAGLRFMEFNARFGDPECLNVMSVLEGSFSELLASLWDGTLPGRGVRFAEKASVTKYLVAKEYPEASERALPFSVDEGAVAAAGVDAIPASCVRLGRGRYETIRKSRVMAFGAVADTVEAASSMVDGAIGAHVQGGLEYRRDIGSAASLEKLGGAAGPAGLGRRP